jgi:hypothetical protein
VTTAIRQTHVWIGVHGPPCLGSKADIMSALPPRADMCSSRAQFCFGPIADQCEALVFGSRGEREAQTGQKVP